MKKERMYPSPEVLEEAHKEGVIEPSKIKPGTTILIETNKHVFEFTLENNGRMYVTTSNTEIVPPHTECKIAGCTDEKGTLFADMIVKEKHLIINLVPQHSRYVTGLVRSASIRGEDWSFELWK